MPCLKDLPSNVFFSKYGNKIKMAQFLYSRSKNKKSSFETRPNWKRQIKYLKCCLDSNASRKFILIYSWQRITSKKENKQSKIKCLIAKD